MKKLLAIWIILFCSVAVQAGEIWVALRGSDDNDGTKEHPKATLHAALRQAREWRRLKDARVDGGIKINISAGTYYLSEAVFIRPEDSGTPESPTIITSNNKETVVLSGGIEIKQWKKLAGNVAGLPANAKANVWVADVPKTGVQGFLFRQLWVNNKKAIRAKDKNGEQMTRILSWNKKDQTCWIPAKALPDLSNAASLEFFIHQWWEIASLRVKQFKKVGDSALLSFYQPESRIQSEHPWPAPWISKETGNSAFNLCNAIQLLDEPGEWWLDVAAQKIYYWPRIGENMATATVVAPYLENILKIEGDIDQRVHDISFENISFMHSSWLRPSLQGHVPHQAGMYMTDAYKLRPAGTAKKASLENQAWIGRPAAAVEVNYAANIFFDGCHFGHLASTGLDFHEGCKSNRIVGNIFYDIGGSAILGGVFSDEATEIHLPYHPKNEQEVCSGLLIQNNVINNAANEDWGCVGIGIGYAKHTLISHNDISNVSYTGISMGWGWSPAENSMSDNQIIANRVHHYGRRNYDCAGIYTLSAQRNSIIEGNVVDSIYKAPYAHLPSHWFYLYTDEGSSYITVKNNWTPSQKYLQNANGPGNVWENNGPQVSPTIKQNAGLEKDYQYLLKDIVIPNQPINEEHQELIEFVFKDEASVDMQKLRMAMAGLKIDTTALYRWKNHVVVFSNMDDIGSYAGKLSGRLPGVEVKPYYDMFYAYKKKAHCADKAVAPAWKHIVLTADLVHDKKLQQEYLAYHATQFEKWPEVSKGFCNADFQQLLLFKRDDQLMLIISIPAGKTLDELNPKTVENNPRVNEWNKIMGKYQQGIKGTKQGETWVFLEDVSSQ